MPSPKPSGRTNRRIAWISDFPVEWLPDVPDEIRALPRQHPTTWSRVFREQLVEHRPEYDLHICVLRKGLKRSIRFQSAGTTFHVLAVPGGVRATSLFWVDTLLLRKVLRQVRPELVHAWGTERGAALVASRLPFPYLVTIQGLLSWYCTVTTVSRHEKAMAFLEDRSLKRTRLITTESCFSADYIRKRYPAAQVDQVEHAPNPLFFRIDRAPQRAPLKILSVGTMGFRKGSDLLLQALARLLDQIDFEAVFLGDPDEGFLAPFRASLPPALWKRVKFLGNTTPEGVAAELATTTLAVLPTRADTSPNAVKEAVVAGVPVVATAIGGIPDYVVNGKNGILCPANDLDALTDALRTAAGHSLFGSGQVDHDCLAENRAYLAPERMRDLFIESYDRTLELFGSRSSSQ